MFESLTYKELIESRGVTSNLEFGNRVDNMKQKTSPTWICELG